MNKFTEDKGTDERILWAELMDNASAYTCPQVEPVQTMNGLIYINSFGKQEMHNCYFLNALTACTEANGQNVSLQFVQDADGNNYSSEYKNLLPLTQLLSIETDNRRDESTDPYSLKEMVSKDNPYIEIVAPFTFSFVNTNITDDDDSLSIINTTGSCKITFHNVANWYCAGAPYPDPIEDDDQNNPKVTYEQWLSHDKSHLTIIGGSSNAKVKGGVAGQVIGYASKKTTVTIEVTGGYGSKVRSLKNWLIKD